MLRFTALAATLLSVGCRAAPLPDRSADADLRRHLQIQTDGGNVYVINPEPEAQQGGPQAVPNPSATPEPAETPDTASTEISEAPRDGELSELPLSSELPDAAFDKLEVLKIEGPHGKVNFKTTGYARYDSEESRCGTVVVVYTGVGRVQFDGVGMMFTETVAGAFSSAGFTVSEPSRKRRGTEDALHAVVGVSGVYGEFRSLAGAVDATEHSCGAEVPEVRAPFDGDHTEVQVEEETLLICGDGQAEDGVPACPAHGELTTDSHGRSYFKRATQMRSKKVDGVWRTIRSTTIPELDADPAVADELRGGRLIELTAGGRTKTYQHFPGSSGAGLGRCLSFNESTVDYTGSIEANTVDNADRFLASFVGYDVFNGHYTKHFKVFVEGGPKAGVDYYESYEESRPYSMGVLAPHVYTTYESVTTDQDVEPGFLQGPGFPGLDAADLDTFFDSIKCADHAEWEKLGSAGGDAVLALDEEIRAAELPDLQAYISAPFVLAEFEEDVARSVADAHAVLEAAGQQDAADLSADGEGNDDAAGRSRRGNLNMGSCHYKNRGRVSIQSGRTEVQLWMDGKDCYQSSTHYPDGFQIEGGMTGQARFNGFTLTGSGSLMIQGKARGAGGGSGHATLSITRPNFPRADLEVKGTYEYKPAYTWGQKPKHLATIGGELAISFCTRRRREALAEFVEAHRESESRSRRFGLSVVQHGVKLYNDVKHYDEAIPGGILPKCPGLQIGVGLTLKYRDHTWQGLRARVPGDPNNGKTVFVFITTMGHTARLNIHLKARKS